ncbi:type II toxin-antitoxin system VapC family toxin [Magnetospirillum moscoviense]|uniref:PIN domain-containing protein n=1 Tax=Magnetospirillum moscoviense TaxID=1437059 RepID=A0A178MA90_9PROT|nr:type II toxin-antitoxin system VapC family toxin [Magnetospirillum moscoviense]OAN44965.1 hypothetical protein A6A05_17190 [Magnetospirillum moscoviense]
MTATYLLDTNVISELARQQPDAGVEAQILAHERNCAIAAPTVEELAYGVARLPASRKRDMLDRWLEAVVARFILLPYDPRCALWLGRERARLTAIGKPAPRADGEIASIAVINDLVLVTRNVADFRDFSGLKQENWFGT